MPVAPVPRRRNTRAAARRMSTRRASPRLRSRSADAVVRTLLSGSPAVGTSGQPRLGLGELPERVDRLASGMVYALACDQQAVRLPLIANAILASVRAGNRCALLAPSHPSVLLRKLRLAGFALEAPLKRGELDLFEVSRDAGKELFRLGADTLLGQLDKHIPERDVLVVLDEADALFQVADLSAAVEAAQRYVEWAAARNHTLLAMFAPAPLAPRDYLNLRRIAESFGGFGLAKPASGGAVLEVRHWFGPEGASARELEPLCRAVAAVRALGRPALRVIVRERGLRLRAGEALALLRLGASTIIPLDVPDTAAKRMADALQGTRFARPYDSDVEHVLAETTVLLAKRPRRAAELRDALERLLAAADGFDVPCSLVRLEVRHLDASRMLALASRNAREVIGFAHQGSVWLFLFGCPPEVAPRVLQRVFIAPVEEISSRWDIRHEPKGILGALRELRSE